MKEYIEKTYHSINYIDTESSIDKGLDLWIWKVKKCDHISDMWAKNKICSTPDGQLMCPYDCNSCRYKFW